MATVHPTAVVHPTAELDDDVEIGPYSVLGAYVCIGAGTTVGAHVIIEENTRIGRNNIIYHGAVLGAPPQDRKFKHERTYLEIGDNNWIREYVTIHRASGEEQATRIGNNNFLMAYVHIGAQLHRGRWRGDGELGRRERALPNRRRRELRRHDGHPPVHAHRQTGDGGRQCRESCAMCPRL
jgi:acetyltransferase-like isoleucine patch superfamily enzyme